jgi:hypothetical protein
MDGDVRSVIPFKGQSSATDTDKLFAVTYFGIYDVTLEGTTVPILDVTFTDQTARAGYGVSTSFTNDAAEAVLFYADSLNGLHMYSESTGLWTVPAITGADPAKVAFVTTWKNRLWMVERDSGDAWYLEPDAIAGAATKFTFGSKFTHGGDLRGLWSWTIDGGAGSDDYLVAISSGGDVLIYTGTDPSGTDFGLHGSWFIGEIPETRRGVVEWGGDLYILSVYGIASIRDLLQGVALTESQSPSNRVSRPIREAIATTKDSEEWALTLHPGDGFMQVIVPYRTATSSIQYVQNLQTRAWGGWFGVPMHSAVEWNGNYFLGGDSGVLWVYDGGFDGSTLAGSTGKELDFEMLTSFQAPQNDHVNNKRVHFIRPVGLVDQSVNISVAAIYDYNLEGRAGIPPGGGLAAGTGAIWDDAAAIWDDPDAIWDFTLQGGSLLRGGSGIGRTFAISTRGRCTTRINILAWDCTYTSGGFL